MYEWQGWKWHGCLFTSTFSLPLQFTGASQGQESPGSVPVPLNALRAPPPPPPTPARRGLGLCSPFPSVCSTLRLCLWLPLLLWPLLFSLVRLDPYLVRSFGETLNCIWFSVFFSLPYSKVVTSALYFLVPAVSAEEKTEAVEFTFLCCFCLKRGLPAQWGSVVLVKHLFIHSASLRSGTKFKSHIMLSSGIL